MLLGKVVIAATTSDSKRYMTSRSEHIYSHESQIQTSSTEKGLTYSSREMELIQQTENHMVLQMNS
jgi:hypothetical protein